MNHGLEVKAVNRLGSGCKNLHHAAVGHLAQRIEVEPKADRLTSSGDINVLATQECQQGGFRKQEFTHTGLEGRGGVFNRVGDLADNGVPGLPDMIRCCVADAAGLPVMSARLPVAVLALGQVVDAVSLRDEDLHADERLHTCVRARK